MGKPLKQQIRGKGTPKYKAPSHRYKVKLSYRPYDELEKNSVIFGEVVDFVDDPSRNTIIATLLLDNNEVENVIAYEGMCIGDVVEIGAGASVSLGNVLPLAKIPEGMYVYNIEKKPGDGGKLARSAGSFGIVVMKEGENVQVKLPSNKMVVLSSQCRAQIGVPAGGGVKEKPLLKAGTAYYKHRAKNKLWPKSRGVKMSAYDHPFGGKQHHAGKATTVSKNAVPGQKVGHLRAKRTGRKK